MYGTLSIMYWTVPVVIEKKEPDLDSYVYHVIMDPDSWRQNDKDKGDFWSGT
jgi:hypothetical protein